MLDATNDSPDTKIFFIILIPEIQKSLERVGNPEAMTSHTTFGSQLINVYSEVAGYCLMLVAVA